MKTLIFLFIVIGLVLLGCSNQNIKDTKEVINVSKGDISKPTEDRGKSQDQEFELYQGKPLNIAILGESPKVKEENIRFTKISFNNLKRETLASYDGSICDGRYSFQKHHLVNTQKFTLIHLFLISLFQLIVISHLQ